MSLLNYWHLLIDFETIFRCSRGQRNWRRALRLIKDRGDPWEKFGLDSLRSEKGIRHRYFFLSDHGIYLGFFLWIRELKFEIGVNLINFLIYYLFIKISFIIINTGLDWTGLDGTKLKICLYCTELWCVRYNPVTQEWLKDECVLKIDKIPFAHGAMRECFR